LQLRRPAFLYDADCGACSRFKGMASFLDAPHAVDFVSIEDAGRTGLLDNVPRSSWYSSSRMVAKDGTVTARGEALLALLSELPGCRFPSTALGNLPHGKTSAEWFYGVLSRVHGSSCAPNTLKPPAGGSAR